LQPTLDRLSPRARLYEPTDGSAVRNNGEPSFAVDMDLRAPRSARISWEKKDFDPGEARNALISRGRRFAPGQGLLLRPVTQIFSIARYENERQSAIGTQYPGASATQMGLVQPIHAALRLQALGSISGNRDLCK